MTRSPASRACSSSKGMTSRSGLVASSHACAEVQPRLTSLACTSARFTVLAAAPARRAAVSSSAPVSFPITARMADASSTMLFIFRGLAALGEQFIHQRCARLYVLPGAALGPLDTALLRSDAQFVALEAKHDLISNFDAEGFAKGGGDYD